MNICHQIVISYLQNHQLWPIVPMSPLRVEEKTSGSNPWVRQRAALQGWTSEVPGRSWEDPETGDGSMGHQPCPYRWSIIDMEISWNPWISLGKSASNDGMFHICETGGYIPQVHLIVTNINVPTHTHDQQFNWLKKADKISQMGVVYIYIYEQSRKP